MKARILAVTVCVIVVVNFASAAMFVDDFESGNLDNWVVGGRQQGTNVADVVSRGGSQVAHLYHRYFTEINLHRDFGYDPMDSYHFDLEVDVSSTGGAPSNYYSWAYLGFQFLDSTSAKLGEVRYGAATTNYPYTAWDDPNPERSANAIAENIMSHYEVSVAEMLSQITIDQAQIDSVRLIMNTYGSTWPSPDVSAQLWADNIQLNPSAVPVPSAALLGILGLSSAGTRLRRRRYLKS